MSAKDIPLLSADGDKAEATSNQDNQNNHVTQSSEDIEGPTDSHVLSQVEQDEKGLSQKAGDTTDITDIGWGQGADHIEERLQVYNVKAVPDAPLQRLDLTRAGDDEFSPDKLRATLERFYITVIVGLTSFVKHIARLRSWKEPRRTVVFCTVYFLAWMVDCFVPTLLAALIALVIYPPCRPVLFPTAPIALVDKDAGGIQKPKAGILGSHDSITGAPENFKGEAAEQEASNMVASVASVAVGSAVGKHDQGIPEDATLENKVPDAMEIVSDTADAQSAAQGRVPTDSHDKTRQPMREAVMDAANMSMQCPVCDAPVSSNISSTTPGGRVRSNFSGLDINIQLCIYEDQHPLRRFGFLRRSSHSTRHRLLESRVPTLAEAPRAAEFTSQGNPNKRPANPDAAANRRSQYLATPPPPISRDKAPSRPASLHPEGLSLGATDEEIEQAASAEPPDDQSPESGPIPDSHHKNTWATKVVSVFRGTTATGVESKRGLDRMRASVGSRHAKNRVGVLRRKGQPITPIGPVEFDARYKGRHGAVVIDSSSIPR
ncbi:hypothetical protein NUU61_003220 [Penicillium alfredii]|uniref:Uncharacterized protein n=1 Tax=Penicillium alfredii TaxID=1506179 RepID=A0A9W9FT54_9EURO|nr:uncharacterized protein NUU61_003220 [Penicillium alfredii]KAJ5105873.1 hypothetical protein NUU61_003220 [Penicillium alfredii]